MFLTLRILHIVTGVFWTGTVFFIVSFLLPAMGKIGPAAGPLGAEFQARKVFVKLPIIGLIAIVTGFWMYALRMQGSGGWAATREAMTLGGGGVSALLALIVGATMARPNQDKVMTIGKEAGGMAAGPEKDAKLALAGVHRAKATMATRVVATLLGITVIAMASARYL